MKLKTLKDLQEKGNEEDFVNCNVVSTKQLRQEAIKHIKHCLSLIDEPIEWTIIDECLGIKNLRRLKSINQDRLATAGTYISFCNITEEDLK